ncbi:MAG: hypothetical protein E2P03_07465 [Acidobacteria bacterium]|nr:MAG: hypothetical protein E2P03_07465 [Acidobacteriota bacterium]
MPGRYSVSLATRIDGEIIPVAGSMSFKTVPLATATVSDGDRAALAAFQKDVAALQRAVLGSVRAMTEASTRIDHLKKGIAEAPAAGDDMGRRVRELDTRLKDLRVEFSGDSTISSRSAPTPPSLVGRVGRVVSGAWNITSAPTTTQQESYGVAEKAFADLLPRLRTLLEQDLVQLEDDLEAAGGPWTPGRLPRWEESVRPAS